MRRKTPATPSNPSGCLIGPQHCLDEDFDAPEDNRDLVQAIVAGKVGLSTDARSNDHDPLSLQPARWRRRNRDSTIHLAHPLPHKYTPPIPRPAPDLTSAEVQLIYNLANNFDAHMGVTRNPLTP